MTGKINAERIVGNVFPEEQALKICQDHLVSDIHNVTSSITEYSWGWLYNNPVVSKDGCCDGLLYSRHESACIAGLLYGETSFPQNDRRAFFHWYKPGKNSEVGRFWLEFLLGPESFYRDLVQAQPRQDLDFVYKYGYVITNQDFHANYVGNFLVAFRMFCERPSHIAFWKYLHDQGCSHASIAVALSFIYTVYEHEVRLSSGCMSHWPYEVHNADFDVFDRLKTASPDKSCLERTRLFSKNMKYTPCNFIWQGDSSVIEGRVKQVFTNFIRRNGKPQESRRMFSRGETQSISMPATAARQQILDFCKAMDDDLPKLVKDFS